MELCFHFPNIPSWHEQKQGLILIFTFPKHLIYNLFIYFVFGDIFYLCFNQAIDN